MSQQPPLESLGMSEEEMVAYLEEMLRQQAAEAAAENGTSVEQELESPGFAAARGALGYAIRLMAANNAFITRRLLDLGVIGHHVPTRTQQ